MAMYNTGQIRLVCGELSRETDPGKIDDLLGLLKAIIQDEVEEARVRTEFIRQKYGLAFKAKVADA